MTYPGDDESYNRRNKSGDGGVMWIGCIMAIAVIAGLLYSTHGHSSYNNSANGNSFESTESAGAAAGSGAMPR